MRLPFWRTRRREQELAQEIDAHLRMAIGDRVAQGQDEAAAAQRAKAEFGNRGLVQEVTRQMWGWNFLDGLRRDARGTLRDLRRNPGFAAVAITTLALGIGANTAVFSVINGVLLRPLPYAEPERLVSIHDGTSADRQAWPACIADVLLWQSRARSFEPLAAFDSNGFTITGDGEAQVVLGAGVTARFFDVLGVRPLMGRTFEPGEDQPGRQATVLISERLWQQRYRGERSILGRTVLLNSRPFVVIGILPSQFRFRMREADVWPILTLNPPTRRGPFFLSGVARLKPGVTLEQAAREMDALGREAERADPKRVEQIRYLVTLLRDDMVGDIRPLLRVLMGTVVLVLLIAILNVANLMLARATARQREMAIRFSIGAGRAQVVRQLLTEGILLALTGAGCGVLLALEGVRALRALAPPGLPRVEEIGIDGRVLLFTVVIAIASGIAFGLTPALGAVRGSLTGALQSGNRGGTESRAYRRLRGALVVGEIAMAVVLLAGAGLLIRSFTLLGRVSAGFHAPPDRVLAMSVAPTGRNYSDRKRLAAYWEQLLERVRGVPGVESAAVTMDLPPNQTAFTDGFEIMGKTPASGGPVVPVPWVSSDYFQTMGIPILCGRVFEPRDTADSPRVVVISENLARRYFPNENPVGQRLKHGGPELNNPYVEIVGVVGDVKYQGLDHLVEPVYYEASAQLPARPMWLVARTRGEAVSLAPAVRGAIRELDPNVPVSHVTSLTSAMYESVALPRFRSNLMSLFAATALILAAVGIYGLVAYSVLQRTQEIGIRMALGATAGSVSRLVVVQGSRLAIAGITLGLAGAIAAARALKTMLFGVQPTDVKTFAGVALVLLVVTLAASLIPARRAARIDPIRALRQE